jgi:class 3 adenylate cyclase
MIAVGLGELRLAKFFRNRWWVVFAAICGLLVGGGPVNVFAFAVFLKPVTESLGIGRELFSSGLIVGSTVAGIGLIPLGFLLDHHRVRRVMMPGLVLYAAGVMGYALMTPSPLHIYLAFAIAALFGPTGSPLPYGAVLSRWFDRQRGLAIGIAMAGVGLGVALVPQIAAVLIRLLGWRLAYVALGGVILLVAWVPVTLFVREPSERDAAAHADVAVEGDLAGLTLSEALFGSWRFWALTVAFFTAIAAINGTLRGDIEEIHAAIWLSDMRGFTALSDRLPPRVMIDLLNRYFDRQVPVILDYGAEVLKFMGDGLLGIFPIDSDETEVCKRALTAARQVQANVAALASSALPGLRFGLALHIGDVLYGNIGSGNHLDFTCIGPAVNCAARIEKLTGQLERAVLASGEFARYCPGEFTALGEFSLAGFSAPQLIYDLADSV